MKTLDQLDTAIAQTNAKVDESNAKIDALAVQAKVEKFSAAARVSTSTAECSSIKIPLGRLLKLESVAVTTNGSMTATVYFAVTMRLSGIDSRILYQRIPLTTFSTDDDKRTGAVQIPMWVRGALVAGSVEDGESYNLQVCADPPAGDSVAADFYVSGVYE